MFPMTNSYLFCCFKKTKIIQNNELDHEKLRTPNEVWWTQKKKTDSFYDVEQVP